MIAAIILAAGASSRMGTPKALLKLGNATFLQTLLDAALATGLSPLVVVVGNDGGKLLSGHEMHGGTVTTNTSPEDGPIQSIGLGIEALINHSVDAAMVLQVDRPHVAIRTLEALIDDFRVSRGTITLPVFGGRRGHPVLFARDVFAELRAAASAGESARDVVRRNATRVRTVEVTDPAVLEDIDTPEDYAKLIQGIERNSRSTD